MAWQEERGAALGAAREACRVCEAVREGLVSAETLWKGDRSPVTVADFCSQALICRRLLAAFPGTAIVAEEDADDLRGAGTSATRRRVLEYARLVEPSLSEADLLDALMLGRGRAEPAGRFWVIDPVDGTKGYLRGEQYAVAIALIEEGRVVLGVLGCPRLPAAPGPSEAPPGGLFHAARGQGARALGPGGGPEEALSVSRQGNPAEAVLCESVEAAHSSQGEAARIAEVLGVRAAPLRMDSQAKYAAVARGEADIYLRLPTRADYEEKVWDHAAGALLVAEAGGHVSDAHGRPLDFAQGRTLRANRGVVATNGALREPVERAVSRVLAAD